MQYHHYKDEERIVCLLCKHYCILKEGKSAICGVNFNENATLLNKTYGYPSAINLDPIEKKPLYHFMPKTASLSIGTVGCNFRCPFCQNHSISQTNELQSKQYFSPQDIVSLALKHKADSISYTYNEPTIWYPYAKDIGVLAKENGLRNIFVSSGYESNEVFEDMKNWLDAINVDLKSFNEEYYKKTLKTNLGGVVENLIKFAKSDIHLEVTTLIIPDVNDSSEEIEKMAEFIVCELGHETPWHLSAFHPDYKMLDTPHTPLATLQMAKDIAKRYGLKYVYIGNVKNDNSTYCPECGELLIQRDGFRVGVVNIKDSKCKNCSYKIKGVFDG